MRVATRSAPPLGAFRVVEAKRLFVDERGSGAPRVVFLPGAGLTGLDYLHLHEPTAKVRSSLLYDRAGTGWSERVALPRTSRQVTDELHELLRVTGDRAVVLVGHSLGGLYARHYAGRFPDAVAGLVLLDPAHEDYDTYMPAELMQMRSGNRLFDMMNVVLDLALGTAPTKALLQMLPPIRRYQRLYRALFDEVLSAWPDDVRGLLVERHVSLEWLAVGLRESRGLEQLYAEVRESGPGPDVPLIILASTGTDGFRDAVSSGESPELLRAEVEGKLRLYENVAASSKQGEVRTVESGHVTLPFRQPDAILQAINDVTR